MRLAPCRPSHVHPYPCERQRLAALIESGELPPGAKLPGEIELGEIYGVSRITVRRAIGELRSAGRLVMVTGKGTFVPRAE